MITSDYSDTQGGLGPLKGRKISLPDEVHDRLWLLARQRKQTINDRPARPGLAPVDARDRAGDYVRSIGAEARHRRFATFKRYTTA